jgi:hypothetical protein
MTDDELKLMIFEANKTDKYKRFYLQINFGFNVNI